LVQEEKMMPRWNKPDEADWPQGHVCNVTPNGKTYEQGSQSPFANGFLGRGCMDTTQVGTKTIERPAANTNRSGESRGGGF
jgi:hypothetical protein